MKKQTLSIEFYRNGLHTLNKKGNIKPEEEKELFEQAKVMEKKQIKSAFNQGYIECSIEDLEPKSRERFVDAENYYHKTFKSE